ncbi:ATP-dependent DNA helicase, partial [Azospirillum brasilense]|nr:ATP-dependent DNA helicase [Azospirillum brasilense]
MDLTSAPSLPSFSLDDAPALVAGARRVVLLTGDGEVEELPPAAAVKRARRQPPLVCHARAMARRLGTEPFAAFDLLGLFAFVLPARFCVPTPRGLAEALDLPIPDGLEDDALALHRAGRKLLGLLGAPGREGASGPVALAWEMGGAGWRGGPAVLSAPGKA